MELTWGAWQIDDIGYGRSKDWSAYLKKPGRNWIRVRLFVRTVEENLRYFRFRCCHRNWKVQLEGRVSVGMKQKYYWWEIRSLDILSVKKSAKLSAREMPGVEVANGDEDVRWSSLLIVCHRRLELSETEETKLEKYCFWKWGSIYGIGYEEIWKKTCLEQSECISRGFQHDGQLIWRRGESKWTKD